MNLLLASSMVVASVFGCSTTPSKPSLMANMAKDDITVRQLRAIDYEYAAQFGQFVAASVLDIVEATDDENVLDSAYQWRMWAVAQARAAAFDQDPFAGMLELWALAGQQRLHFTEGGGKNAFGDQQGRAVATAEQLESDIRDLAADVMEPNAFETLSDNVDKWIDNHPIEGRLFVRPTARADLAGLVSEDKQGGLKAVGNIEETFSDLNDRISILTVQMPTEARWQAEYLTRSLFEERIAEPAESIADTMETMESFLGEFEGTLSAQTVALLDGIQGERIAIFDAVSEESKDILSAIEEERVSVMTELDARLTSATGELDKVGKGLIDHFFVRLIEVLAVVGVVMILTVLLVLVLVRKRRSGDD